MWKKRIYAAQNKNSVTIQHPLNQAIKTGCSKNSFNPTNTLKSQNQNKDYD